MLMYAWMVFIEYAPTRYDWAVKFMTGGRINKIKKIISSKISKGDTVLDIGCGTGSLGELCLANGAKHFTGIDSSDYMLKVADKRLSEKHDKSQFTLVKDSVTQLKKNFKKQSFDAIVSTMAIGEFPKDYLDFIFSECRDLLKPGGKLLIADEVWPTKLYLRILYRIVMTIMWIPQFIILRRAFFPVRNLKGTIANAGFKVKKIMNWPFSTFQLVIANNRGEK